MEESNEKGLALETALIPGGFMDKTNNEQAIQTGDAKHKRPFVIAVEHVDLLVTNFLSSSTTTANRWASGGLSALENFEISVMLKRLIELQSMGRFSGIRDLLPDLIKKANNAQRIKPILVVSDEPEAFEEYIDKIIPVCYVASDRPLYAGFANNISKLGLLSELSLSSKQSRALSAKMLASGWTIRSKAVLEKPTDLTADVNKALAVSLASI